MKVDGTALLWLLAAAALLQGGSAASTFTVNPWVLTGNMFPDLDIPCGGAIAFVWPSGQVHGVAAIPSSNCPTTYTAPGITVINPGTLGPANVTVPLTVPGVYYFASPVTGECQGGLLIKAIVGGCPPPPPAPKPPPPKPPVPAPPAPAPSIAPTAAPIAAAPASAPTAAPTSSAAAAQLSVVILLTTALWAALL